MRLTVDMPLTRNSCLINGCEIVGGAFVASTISLVQHCRASKYFGKRHSWRSHLQAHLAATCQRGTKPWNGRRATTLTNLLSVSSRMLLLLAMFLENFRRCFGTSSGTEGPSLVKLPVKEGVVKD